MNLRRAAVLTVVALTVCGAAQAETKADKIKDLLIAAGIEPAIRQSVDQMLSLSMPGMRNALRDAPPEFIAFAEEEMRNGFKDMGPRMIEMAVPLYSEVFSEGEIDQLRAFYNSSIGRKIVQAQPGLMQRSMQAGAHIGQQIGMQAMERAQARYKAAHSGK